MNKWYAQSRRRGKATPAAAAVTPDHGFVHGSPSGFGYNRPMISRRAILAGAAAATVGPAGWRSARAGTHPVASDWSEASHSAVRLIAGGATPDGLAAGVEFRLASGFKTYWRDPGDSGVPPTLDWAGSENCKSINVLWPAPERFEDGAGFSIGYRDPLILPIVVTPADARAPARLQLSIGYAICEKLCIPAKGQAALALEGTQPSALAARIAEAIAKVPAETGLGATAASGLSIVSVGIAGGAKPALVADVLAPAGPGPTDLFVEGPKGSFFSRPAIARTGDGAARLASPIESRPAGLAAWPLRLTLVAGGRSIEVATTVDASALH